MNAHRLLTPALLTALLAGCAVGPDYRRPDTALPQSFAEAPAAANAEAAPPAAIQQDWWTLFGDATLNELVQKALVYNTDLQAAVARVEEAQGLLREAGAAQWPQVNAQLGTSRMQTSKVTATAVPGAPNVFDDRSAALTTSFEIDLWGRLRRATEAARAQALSTIYARDTVQLSIAGLVAANYLALRAHDAELVVTQESLQSRESALRIAKSRFEGGLASPLDVHQAESALAAAQAQLVTVRQQRALAQNQLGLLTGQPGLAIVAGDLR